MVSTTDELRQDPKDHAMELRCKGKQSFGMEAGVGGVVVDMRERIPKVCLKCGATKSIVRRVEILTVASQNAATMGMGMGAVGATVAAIARNNRDAAIPVVLAAIAGVTVFAVVMHRGAEKVELELPLCETCNARWNSAKRVQPAFLAGVVIAGLLCLVGWTTDGQRALLYAGAIVFALVIVAALALRPGHRLVGASRVEGPMVTLTQISPEAATKIAARLEKRRAKSEQPEQSESGDDGVDHGA